MKIYYDDGTDLLYLRFDEREQLVENRRVAEDIVLDIGGDGKIVGIEILDASSHVNLRICFRPTTMSPHKGSANSSTVQRFQGWPALPR